MEAATRGAPSNTTMPTAAGRAAWVRSLPPPQLCRRELLACERCKSNLLACDFIGHSAVRLDTALQHHRFQCVETQTTSGARGIETALAKSSVLPWPDEEPPLTFCARHGLHDLAKQIIQQSAHCSPAKHSYAGAHINHIAPSGYTALHFAATRGDEATIRLLLAAAADPCVIAQDGGASGCVGGQLPLHCAAACGHEVAVRLLLEAPKASSSAAAVDWDGQPPPRARCTLPMITDSPELCDAADRRPRSSTVPQAPQSLQSVPSLQHGAAPQPRASGAGDGHDEAQAAAANAAETAELVAEVRQEAGRGQMAEEAEASAQVAEQRLACAQRLRLLGRNERERERLCIKLRPRMRVAHLLTSLLTSNECAAHDELSDAAALHGWQSSRRRPRQPRIYRFGAPRGRAVVRKPARASSSPEPRLWHPTAT